MKIGIIGAGIVAKTLGSGLLKEGHEVMLGTRDSAKLADWVSNNQRSKVGTTADAAGFGDLIILAVKGAAAKDALAQAGADQLKGKTVIDTTNPIDETNPPTDGVLHFFTGKVSLMEALQAQVPDAHFVKAFNSVGSYVMVHPQFKEGRPGMFICGNDDGAKKEVASLLDTIGWEVEDMGKANAAGAIESLCILWCIPGFRKNEWTHAFKLLKP